LQYKPAGCGASGANLLTGPIEEEEEELWDIFHKLSYYVTLALMFRTLVSPNCTHAKTYVTFSFNK
jgi:hypothetical protein